MQEKLNKIFEAVRIASRKINRLDEDRINAILNKLADATVANADSIIEANKLDLALMQATDPKYDRLKLTQERIEGIASDMRNVAKLPSPLGRVMLENKLANGMTISKVSVPFGVIGVIYEARPNVTFDVFSLALKAGSATILKGGSDANNSNMAIVALIHKVLEQEGIDLNCVVLLPTDHEATAIMLRAVGRVDLIIPRGSQRLINFVRDNSRVPVIETGAGICHTYFHSSGDLAKGSDIIFNAKTRRVSVCNALDCLIIDANRLGDLPALVERMASKNVIIYADKRSYAAIQGKYLLLESIDEVNGWGEEYLDYKMSIKTVDTLDEAIEHISTYSSKHSEAIISEDCEACARFSLEVDAACVYTNVSTAFTDGAQFGFGAEIGISTQKLHARGPMALPEITTYKYIIKGDGQTRNN